MVWQYKKIFLIFFSITFGGLVIFSAYKVTNGSIISFEGQPDGDDTWRSALSVIPGEKTATRAIKGDITEGLEETSNATSTTIVARRLLSEYALYQKNSGSSEVSEMSKADAENIAATLINEVKLPPKTQYELFDLNISSDNSVEAGITYKTSLNTLIANHAETEKVENETSILEQAVNTGDASILSKLNIKASNYQQLIEKLLVLKTPSDVAPLHLRLLQSYETLRAATVGFQSVLVDPVVGMASLTEYRDGAETLSVVGQEYYDYFSNQ